MATREERLTSTFVELADNLVADFDIVELMVLLTERVVEILDAAGAGILLAGPTGELRLIAATSEAATTVELFQVQNHEGPSHDCFRTGRPVLHDDLRAGAGRWSRFSEAAIAGGFLAAHAFPMRLRGQVVGALNVLRSEPSGLSAPDVDVAQALSDVATIALIQSRALSDSAIAQEQMQSALASRVAIEQAKGVIAERAGCDTDEAFRLLRGYARARRRRLSAVAAEVVAGAVHPGDFERRRRPG